MSLTVSIVLETNCYSNRLLVNPMDSSVKGSWTKWHRLPSDSHFGLLGDVNQSQHRKAAKALGEDRIAAVDFGLIRKTIMKCMMVRLTSG